MKSSRFDISYRAHSISALMLFHIAALPYLSLIHPRELFAVHYLLSSLLNLSLSFHPHTYEKVTLSKYV